MVLIELDVSKLQPPEPMREICSNLQTLQSGQALHVYHRREPVPLYAILKQQGFSVMHLAVSDAEHHLWIWHSDDTQTHIQLIEQYDAFSRP